MSDHQSYHPEQIAAFLGVRLQVCCCDIDGEGYFDLSSFNLGICCRCDGYFCGDHLFETNSDLLNPGPLRAVQRWVCEYLEADGINVLAVDAAISLHSGELADSIRRFMRSKGLAGVCYHLDTQMENMGASEVDRQRAGLRRSVIKGVRHWRGSGHGKDDEQIAASNGVRLRCLRVSPETPEQHDPGGEEKENETAIPDPPAPPPVVVVAPTKPLCVSLEKYKRASMGKVMDVPKPPPVSNVDLELIDSRINDKVPAISYNEQWRGSWIEWGLGTAYTHLFGNCEDMDSKIRVDFGETYHSCHMDMRTQAMSVLPIKYGDALLTHCRYSRSRRSWFWECEEAIDMVVSRELLAQLVDGRVFQLGRERKTVLEALNRRALSCSFVNLDRDLAVSGRNVVMDTVLVALLMYDQHCCRNVIVNLGSVNFPRPRGLHAGSGWGF